MDDKDEFFLFPKIKDKELIDFFQNLESEGVGIENEYGIPMRNLDHDLFEDEVKVTDEEVEEFITRNNL